MFVHLTRRRCIAAQIMKHSACEREGELLHRPNVLSQNALCRCTVRWNEAAVNVDAAAFAFGTKAETLAALSGRLRCAALLKQVHFTLRDWRDAPTRCLAAVNDQLGTGALIVRSSCHQEDLANATMAGAFESVGHVSGASSDEIAGAVEYVADSYSLGHTIHALQV